MVFHLFFPSEKYSSTSVVLQLFSWYLLLKDFRDAFFILRKEIWRRRNIPKCFFQKRQKSTFYLTAIAHLLIKAEEPRNSAGLQIWVRVSSCSCSSRVTQEGLFGGLLFALSVDCKYFKPEHSSIYFREISRMPQGKLFHISWSIFTTQTSAHHFLISERCNDSILFLKGSYPPSTSSLPLSWGASVGDEWMWGFLCNVDKDSQYCPIPPSGQKTLLGNHVPKQWEWVLQLNSQRVALLIESKDKEASRHGYKHNWRQRMWNHKPRALVVHFLGKFCFTFLSPSPEVWRPNTNQYQQKAAFRRAHISLT